MLWHDVVDLEVPEAEDRATIATALSMGIPKRLPLNGVEALPCHQLLNEKITNCDKGHARFAGAPHLSFEHLVEWEFAFERVI